MSALKTLVGANYTVDAIAENPNVAKAIYNLLWASWHYRKLFGNFRNIDMFVAQKIEKVVNREFPYLFKSIGGATLKRNIQEFIDRQYTVTGFEKAYLDRWVQYLDEAKVKQWVDMARHYTRDEIAQNERIAAEIYDVVQFAAVADKRHAPHVTAFLRERIENELPFFALKQFTTGVDDFIQSISDNDVFLNKYLEYWQHLQDPHGWNPARMARMEQMLLAPNVMINTL